MIIGVILALCLIGFLCHNRGLLLASGFGIIYYGVTLDVFWAYAAVIVLAGMFVLAASTAKRKGGP